MPFTTFDTSPNHILLATFLVDSVIIMAKFKAN